MYGHLRCSSNFPSRGIKAIARALLVAWQRRVCDFGIKTQCRWKRGSQRFHKEGNGRNVFVSLDDMDRQTLVNVINEWLNGNLSQISGGRRV